MFSSRVLKFSIIRIIKIVNLKTTVYHFGYFTMKMIFLDPLRLWGVEGKSQLEGASKQIY